MEIDLASFGRAALFLGIPFVLMVFFFQWKWAETCKKFIRVLVVQQGGGGSFELAPKSGGEISIKNPHSNTTRTWAVNELTTIEVLYPGVGFVPAFMQKTIRMAVVHEGDWEPLLNRSPHLRKVASPDIVMTLEGIIKVTKDDKVKGELLTLLDGISTSPTREMIASPAVLGNLIHEKITEVVATVAKDIFDPLREILKKLGKPVNPMVVYIGLGLSVILLGYLIFQVVPVLKDLKELGNIINDINLIKQALGIR